MNEEALKELGTRVGRAERYLVDEILQLQFDLDFLLRSKNGAGLSQRRSRSRNGGGGCLAGLNSVLQNSLFCLQPIVDAL